MRINKLTDYAIVVMTNIAAMESKKIHTAKEISEISKIPLPTVTRVLKTLCSGSLLESQRGSQGGYALTKAPSSISIATIIECFEGPIALTECATSDCACSYETTCSAQKPWQKINETVKLALDKMKLNNMIETSKSNELLQLNMNLGG